MKKFVRFTLSVLSCLIFLTACSEKDQYFTGEPSDIQLDDEGYLVSLVVTDADGKQTGFLMTERTSIFSHVDGMEALDFFRAPTPDAYISVSYDPGKTTLTTSDGKKVPAYPARFITLNSILIPDAARLRDGTTLSLRQWSGTATYCLPDGTELLNVHDAVNGAIDSQAVNANLSASAQKNISAYYEERGLLYSVEDELERAYSNMPTHVNGQPVPGLGQDIYPGVTSERVIYILTSLTLPVYGDPAANVTEVCLCDAFDRETGERIDGWDLFTCSPEEAAQALLDLAQITDPTLRAEMAAAFRPEYMLFYSSNLEVFLPRGSVPSAGTAWGFGLDYDDNLRTIFHDWALPK